MTSNTELIQQIAEIITDTIRKALESEGRYDRTYTASVVSKIGGGKYNVKYNGAEHVVRSNIALSEGDVVMVCAPCNDDSAIFVVAKVS